MGGIEEGEGSTENYGAISKHYKYSYKQEEKKSNIVP